MSSGASERGSGFPEQHHRHTYHHSHHEQHRLHPSVHPARTIPPPPPMQRRLHHLAKLPQKQATLTSATINCRDPLSRILQHNATSAPSCQPGWLLQQLPRSTLQNSSPPFQYFILPSSPKATLTSAIIAARSALEFFSTMPVLLVEISAAGAPSIAGIPGRSTCSRSSMNLGCVCCKMELWKCDQMAWKLCDGRIEKKMIELQWRSI